jgi:hypothetical protein
MHPTRQHQEVADLLVKMSQVMCDEQEAHPCQEFVFLVNKHTLQMIQTFQPGVFDPVSHYESSFEKGYLVEGHIWRTRVAIATQPNMDFRVVPFQD